ncbi:MAG: ABC transporter ATP-binding protein [Rhodospirillales bacterium]|nr:ABC transporter ATP-binding protein [Rhodospirillales bacterium]
MGLQRPVISLIDVVKRFETPGGVFTALDGINLTIRAGECLAIVGKSGSGKSTLVNMITGLDRPSGGEVRTRDLRIDRLGESALARWRGLSVGIVFQFFQLLPALTIAENVMLPMDFMDSVPRDQRHQRAMTLLDRVGIADQADKLPSALSGGQQQRAAIARALANNPAILVADEPTGNLDSRNAEAVFELFADLARAGTAMVVVTHERDVGRLVDRTVTLSDGKIVADAAFALRPLGECGR